MMALPSSRLILLPKLTSPVKVDTPDTVAFPLKVAFVPATVPTVMFGVPVRP